MGIKLQCIHPHPAHNHFLAPVICHFTFGGLLTSWAGTEKHQYTDDTSAQLSDNFTRWYPIEIKQHGGV